MTKTVFPVGEKQRFLSEALKAFELCLPVGRWDIAGVEKVDFDGILLEDGCFIAGGDFARRCAGISHLWFASVTVGNEVIRYRDQADAGIAVICDAVASETADAAMDLLQKLASGELIRQGLDVGIRRFSPGYGDMPLELQKFFFRRLKLAELNMNLNENMFITPEKSVTAFAGVTTI